MPMPEYVAYYRVSTDRQGASTFMGGGLNITEPTLEI